MKDSHTKKNFGGRGKFLGTAEIIHSKKRGGMHPSFFKKLPCNIKEPDRIKRLCCSVMKVRIGEAVLCSVINDTL